ncbi:Integrase, catalytic core [Gossypium australe]|uniref:Integrase, catalytic core n=1 Tax=Gossypium australe TaxID=47621 RepID=A0A5B6URH0_9ROSI|nr:Integrase, catalytic core [Gossypium australe]
MTIANNIRVLGYQFSNERIVEKVITTLLEKYESWISSLEDSRGLSMIFLSELINALYAQEKRRENRQEEHSKGAFQAKNKEGLSSSSNKGRMNWNEIREKQMRDSGKNGEAKERISIHNALIARRPHTWRNITSDAELVNDLATWRGSAKTKGNNTNRISKLKLLMGIKLMRSKCSLPAAMSRSGCTNHMSSDERIFKGIDRRFTSRIRIGNGQFIKAKEK